MKLGIISGYYPGQRFGSPVNHQAYADFHGYNYIFSSNPEMDRRHYFRKIENILRYLELFDWIYWIDDDAYFTDISKPLLNFIDNDATQDLIICKSPSTKKLFTKFSSGQFFLRNTPRAKQFLLDALNVNMKDVEAMWRPDLGYFSNGDQDAFVYLTETQEEYGPNFIDMRDHFEFNNRDFEFNARLDEHFLVHFTGKDKVQSKKDFCEKLSVNRFLLPDNILCKYFISPNDLRS